MVLGVDGSDHDHDDDGDNEDDDDGGGDNDDDDGGGGPYIIGIHIFISFYIIRIFISLASAISKVPASLLLVLAANFSFNLLTFYHDNGDDHFDLEIIAIMNMVVTLQVKKLGLLSFVTKSPHASSSLFTSLGFRFPLLRTRVGD